MRIHWLCLRSTLMDKLFIFFMDWRILGGAVPPGSPSGSARPQRSKHQKTENERHAPCTRTSCPDTEHPARVLRVIHSAFSLLPTPSPLPRTLLLPGYILKWFLFSICIAPSWSQSPACLTWAAATCSSLVPLLLLSLFHYPPLLSSQRDFISQVLSLIYHLA